MRERLFTICPKRPDVSADAVHKITSFWADPATFAVFFNFLPKSMAKFIDKFLKSAILFKYAEKRRAPLAQLDRALVYGTKG